MFALCRTSDLYNDKLKTKKGNLIPRQRARYQLFTFFSEKLGRIKVDEMIISHTKESIEVQFIGMKNILLSKKIIQLYDWKFIKNSFAMPYVDAKGKIKGCQFLM